MADQVEKSLPCDRYQQFISSLPLYEGWGPLRIRKFQGFWYPEIHLPGLLAFREQFNPRSTDIFLCSPPKSGTTWLKALTFATVTRKYHNPSAQDHPLLRMHPHDCVPLVDEVYWRGQASQLEALAAPRILSAHAAYQLLPESVTNSDCKFVYICRDPKDTIISGWHYLKEMTPSTVEPVPFCEAFDMYCEGISSFGPVWEHQLGYWRESLRRPSKILFLKYEEVMQDPEKNVIALAEFLNFPFSQEEVREGVVGEIVKLCSFQSLKGAEGNREGDRGYKGFYIKNSSFFRKGKVGDWKNYLTPEMAQKLDGIFAEKLCGSGLSFCWWSYGFFFFFSLVSWSFLFAGSMN